MYGWSFYIEDRPWDCIRNLHIRKRMGPGQNAQAVTNIIMSEVNEGEGIQAVSCIGMDGYDDTRSFLQAAMDCAWENGMRPAAYEDSRQELTATKYHLEDMRKLSKVDK